MIPCERQSDTDSLVCLRGHTQKCLGGPVRMTLAAGEQFWPRSWFSRLGKLKTPSHQSFNPREMPIYVCVCVCVGVFLFVVIWLRCQAVVHSLWVTELSNSVFFFLFTVKLFFNFSPADITNMAMRSFIDLLALVSARCYNISQMYLSWIIKRLS